METQIKFRFIEDPGHGWLEVPAAVSRSVGVRPEQYSPYSYSFKPGFGGDEILYLEEDCDAGVFVRAWEKKHGPIAPRVVNVHEEVSTIRPLPHLDGREYNREARS